MSDGMTIQSHKGAYDVLFDKAARDGLAALAAGDRPLHVIVNCAVTRFDPTLCWRVNT